MRADQAGPFPPFKRGRLGRSSNCSSLFLTKDWKRIELQRALELLTLSCHGVDLAPTSCSARRSERIKDTSRGAAGRAGEADDFPHASHSEAAKKGDAKRENMNLRKLFVDVFDPEPGEIAAFFVDLPHSAIEDTKAWQERREMAERWRAAMSELGAERGFEVLPLVNFEATGTNNGELPANGRMEGRPVVLEEIGARATLILAMTQFSASAPLIGWSKRFPQLRSASMPKVAPEMEATALAADYALVARSCERLRLRLAAAETAEIEFSTDDRFVFDFRFRVAEADDGYLHRDAPEPRQINLPSGETFTAAYEGERDVPSRTSGVLPVPFENEIVRLRVENNRVEEVIGDSAAARKLRDFLFADPGRCNVAELGLGCNPTARVWGNVLEDEKAGPHIALGRSEHLGGVTGPDAFSDPRHVWHEDFVYARQSPIQIRRLTLVNAEGHGELLFENGSYVPDLEIGI
jgi:hypothetical protein